MINKLTIGGLVLFCSTALATPQAIAEMEEPNETRIEKYEDLTETEPNTAEPMADMEPTGEEGGAVEPSTRTEETLEEAQSSDLDSAYDVRRTEAFNLVSSAYRGDFEDQGVNSYGVLISNYEAGELTAEDLVDAAIEAGELSPSAMEDSSYINAVDEQLAALTNN